MEPTKALATTTYGWVALWVAAGIAAGALGAHALKPLLNAEALESFKTAVFYHLLQGVALFALLPLEQYKIKLLWPFRLIFGGAVLFSTSIYLLVLDQLIGVSLNWLGPITPLGGLGMIGGWLWLGFALLRRKSTKL